MAGAGKNTGTTGEVTDSDFPEFEDDADERTLPGMDNSAAAAVQSLQRTVNRALERASDVTDLLLKKRAANKT